MPQFGVRSYALLSRPPLVYHRSGLTARLACIRHAASVHPEPGSNSPSRPHDQPTPKEAGQPNLRIRNQQTMTLARIMKSASKKSLPSSEEPGRGGLRPSSETYKALAFNTLLSSQETDTHHPTIHNEPSSGATHPTYQTPTRRQTRDSEEQRFRQKGSSPSGRPP